MKDSGQAAAYARAVYDAALAGWLRDLAALRDNLRAEVGARAALEDTGVDFGARRTLIDRLLPVGAGHDLRNFAYTLLSAGHLGVLDETILELRRLQRHGPNVIVGHVTTAVSPSDEEKAAIERNLGGRYGPDLDVVWHVDPSILGGIVVRVGDGIVDDSLASRLELLRTTLKGHA
ncbi:MAG: F0F1 ATP synthase subunit delta [Anaerolineae bacterium]